MPRLHPSPWSGHDAVTGHSQWTISSTVQSVTSESLARESTAEAPR